MKALIAFGIGAAAMYLLDPEQGRRRRALLRDQLSHAKRAIGERRQLEPAKPLQAPEGARHLGR